MSIATRLNESSGLLFVAALGWVTSILKQDRVTLRSVCTGLIGAGFVAYIVNSALLSYDVDENMRAVCVGCAAHLNIYLIDALNKFAQSFASDPAQAIKQIKKIWSDR